MVSHETQRALHLRNVRNSFGLERVVGFAAVAASVSLLSSSAFAVGNLKMESSGFLRRSVDRPDSVTTLSIGPQVGSTGKYVETKLDAQAIVQLNDSSSLTGEARDMFLATSPRLMWNHQVTLGRRYYDWASVDEAWKTGIYTPRFNWDPTRLQEIGMTGLFYQYRSNHFRALGYASPISIPERGYPMKEENGQFVTGNPFNNPLPNNAVVSNSNLPVVYKVNMPPMSQLLTHGGGAMSFRYFSDRENKGLFGQVNFAYLPIHQPHLAVKPEIIAATPDRVTVNIYPTVLMHRMVTFETGYKSSRANTYFSVTQENPEHRDVPSDWITTPLNPAQIVSAGGDVMVGKKVKLKASGLYITEEKGPTVENTNFKVDLPGRFMYRRAAQAGIEVYGNSRMTYELRMINDFETESQMASVDLTYNLVKKDRALTFSLGSDFFASATSKGWFGQYKGNDRFRGGVSYAF